MRRSSDAACNHQVRLPLMPQSVFNSMHMWLKQQCPPGAVSAGHQKLGTRQVPGSSIEIAFQLTTMRAVDKLFSATFIAETIEAGGKVEYAFWTVSEQHSTLSFPLTPIDFTLRGVVGKPYKTSVTMTFNTALVAASREKFRLTPEYMTEEMVGVRHGLKLAVSHSASTWLASTDYGLVTDDMKSRFPRGIRRALRRVLELEAEGGANAEDEEVELRRPAVLDAEQASGNRNENDGGPSEDPAQARGASTATS